MADREHSPRVRLILTDMARVCERLALQAEHTAPRTPKQRLSSMEPTDRRIMKLTLKSFRGGRRGLAGISHTGPRVVATTFGTRLGD